MIFFLQSIVIDMTDFANYKKQWEALRPLHEYEDPDSQHLATRTAKQKRYRTRTFTHWFHLDLCLIPCFLSW